MTPQYTIQQDAKVGIYENCCYTARVYRDKIVTISPYVKWIGNTGCYAERRETIRDPRVVSAVLADLSDGSEDSAWGRIGRALQDDYLMIA